MKTTKKTIIFALLSSGAFLFFAAVQAQAALTIPPHLVLGHGGVSVPYIDGSWNLKVVDSTSGTAMDYAVDDALFYVGQNTAVNTDVIPTSFYPWMGTSAGQTVYVVPQTLVADTAYFGFNVSGMDDADKAALAAWEPDDSRLAGLHDEHEGEEGEEEEGGEAWIRIDLLSVKGLDGGAAPGEFSLWTTSDEGTQVWMSTAETPAEGNVFYLDVEHGHSHVNWGFTAPGVYEIELQASTYLASDPETLIASAPATYHFGVLTTVPEPSSAALLLGGVLASAAVVWRKRSA